MFVFPNPTNEKIRITDYIDGFFTYENIRLMNSFGQVIHSIDKASSQTYFDLSNLAAGVYYIRLVSDGQIQTFKIIKE